MKIHMRLGMAIAVAAAVGSHGGPVTAQHAHDQSPAGLGVPAALKAEHEELHRALASLLALPGKTGEAARQVEHLLEPHFQHEEAYALPQLGLLHALGTGAATPGMRPAIALSDRLEADLPKMLAEHQAIVGALDGLARAGKSENRPEAAEFAETLTHHAHMEEQVLYPAALLVGRYLKTQLR